MRSRPRIAILVLATSLAGCGIGPAATPAGMTPSAGLVVSPRPSPEATAAPSPTVTPAPTGTLIYEVSKNEVAAGGHGGPPLLTFPGSFVVDYTASGTCAFTVGFVRLEGPDATLPRFDLAVTGTTRSGTWAVTIPPGDYYPSVGPESGCTYHVVMHTLP